MGLLVDIYRAVGSPDCTNGGVSSMKIRGLCVVNVNGPFEPDSNYPAVRLVKGPMDTARLVPEDLIESNDWVMFGGNYGATSDSRFVEAVKRLIGVRIDAVKIFDRVENY